jgi:hypothetical protein
MKSPGGPAAPGVSAEFLALHSIAVACSTADENLNELAPGISAARRTAFLDESIFFHHFLTVAAVFDVFPGSNFSRAYCDRMVAAIHPEAQFPPNEELGLAPLTIFSAKDRADAIKRCFFSPGNIVACLHQELYLGRRPSESDLKVMNLKTVREMTGWDSPSANTVEYFAAALLARLATALKIDPEERFLDFMKLSFHASAESMAAFKLYIGLLGAGSQGGNENDNARVGKAPEAKGNWFTRLFK